MSLQVRPETEAKINALAAASGASVDEYLAALVNRQSLGEEIGNLSTERAGSCGAAPHMGSHCRQYENVPPEDFAALPKDGLSQIDHYVYSVPKRIP